MDHPKISVAWRFIVHKEEWNLSGFALTSRQAKVAGISQKNLQLNTRIGTRRSARATQCFVNVRICIPHSSQTE
jgi:hypothetical protein